VSRVASEPGPPGPLPEPPPDLAARAIPLRTFERPVWFRGHKAHRGPLFFNRSSGRFAAPREEFGTLYLGEDEFCSFIEAFSQELLDLGPVGPIVSQGRLARCCLCPVVVTRTIQFVDLTNGPALRRLSAAADNRIDDGQHAVSQQSALAFWDHPSRPAGLLPFAARPGAPCHRPL
jgi:hypothetical protein